LGALRRFEGRTAKAIPLFEEALTDLEAQVGSGNPLLLRVLDNLAVAYAEAGRPADVEAAYVQSIDIAARKLGTAHPMCGKLLLNYSRFLKRTGRKREAKALKARASGWVESAWAGVFYGHSGSPRVRRGGPRTPRIRSRRRSPVSTGGAPVFAQNPVAESSERSRPAGQTGSGIGNS
jgi:Tetratricopeptide repeat